MQDRKRVDCDSKNLVYIALIVIHSIPSEVLVKSDFTDYSGRCQNKRELGWQKLAVSIRQQDYSGRVAK